MKKQKFEKMLENPTTLTKAEISQNTIGKDKHMTTWASGCRS